MPERRVSGPRWPSRATTLHAIASASALAWAKVHIHRLSTLLDGELIDVVPWRDDPVRRVRMAVAPANVARLELDERQAIAHVTLRDDETALALVADLAHREIADRFAGWQLDLTIEHATA